jgi:hypothetical protein
LLLLLVFKTLALTRYFYKYQETNQRRFDLV